MIGRKDSTTEKLYRILANFSRSVKNMIGATHSSDGAAGLVPPPRAGDEDKALLGNGTWGKVDSIYKYKTEEEYNQAVANNEIPDGATVIKEWDEELSVIPVDSELSEESLNPLQNKIITQKISELNQSIEELNGLLGDKLDVSKIANNLVTTEAGYALDARMGKVLSDELNATKANTYNDGNLFNTGSFILGNRVCCGMFITPFGWDNYTVFGCTEPWREATSKCIIYNLSTQSMITPIADEDSFKATIPAGNLIIAFARFNI